MVRVGHLQPTRPEWWDRNPIARHQAGLTGGAGPVVQTTVWTYTVPTNKKAWLAYAQVSFTVDQEGTGGGLSNAFINVSDGVTTSRVGFIQMRSTNRGAGEVRSGAVGWMMPAGVQLLGVWNTNINGGNMTVIVDALVTEYDA